MSRLKIFPRFLIYEGIKFTDIKKSNLLLEIFMTGTYEEEIIYFLDLFEYDHFIDIGANIGFFCFFIKKKKNWNVTAYEAYSENVKYIKKLMKVNNIQFEINEYAISDKKGKSNFYIPTSEKSSELAISSTLDIDEFKRIYHKRSYKAVEVNTIPFAKILEKINKKKEYLIKIDTEGSEFKILSSTRILKKLNNIDLIVEFNINNPQNDKLFKLLKNFGYNSFLMTNKGMIHEQKILTIPVPKINAERTVWRNHFFTKKNIKRVNKVNYEKNGFII